MRCGTHSETNLSRKPLPLQRCNQKTHEPKTAAVVALSCKECTAGWKRYRAKQRPMPGASAADSSHRQDGRAPAASASSQWESKRAFARKYISQRLRA